MALIVLRCVFLLCAGGISAIINSQFTENSDSSPLLPYAIFGGIMLLAFAVVQGIQTELYRFPFVISFRTYVVAGVVTVLASVASGWLVRRRIDRLDLISVLKTRE